MFSNIFPIEIEFKEFTINRVNYSEELLKTLRTQYNKTHSFFKKDNFIYISNKSGEDIDIGEAFTFNIYEQSGITESLMRHIFFKTFLERFTDRVPVDFHPFRFLSSREVDDWINSLLPTELKSKIGYKKLIEFQIRFFDSPSEESFGVVLNIEHRWTFNINCKELLSLNFDPCGYEILHSEPISGLDGILAPNEEYLGTLVKIDGDHATVLTSDGEKLLPANELYLRKTNFNIKSFLSSYCGERKAEEIFSKIKTTKRDSLKHKFQWSEIQKVAGSFCWAIPSLKDEKILYQNKDGFVFTIRDRPKEIANSFELKNPTFVFDQSAVKTTNLTPDSGLSNYGPYDSNVFDVKTPAILSICLKNNRGRFTNFLKCLFDGITDSIYFKKGLKGKFELHNVISQVEDISDYNVEEYKRILTQLEHKPNLVIIEFDDKIKEHNPQLYYEIKALMLTREIPMQVVLKSRIDTFNEYILNSISLQIYAKLGGIPWVLKSSISVDREIIIGIGHSIIRKSAVKGSEQNRVVGITTFFSSDGQYLLSNKANDVPYEMYFEELLKRLKESFAHLEAANNWKENDTVRLIFHIFKPIKNVEFEVIAKLIKSFPKYRIQFAFVTVGKAHPFLLFDINGGKLNYRQVRIGELVPNRGSNFLIDKHSCLVQMLGGREVKSDFHGASNPLLVKIRVPKGDMLFSDIEPLLFTDMQYIIQQLFSFTYLSWRNYIPSEQPVTMLYSSLIAKQLGRLRKVESWNPDTLNYNLKSKKWFL